MSDELDRTSSLVNAPPTILAAAPPEIGGRYELRGQLGRGSMGVVYRAYDRDRDAEVAVKMLPHLAPEDVYYLKREFRSLAGITHPNIIRLHDLVVDERSCFFTMELVEGTDLLEFVRGARSGANDVRPHGFRLEHLTRAFLQIVDALEALHGDGQLHRDLKPPNVLVDHEGRVVVLDFGLAVQAFAPDRESNMVGTVGYMSPEQFWRRPLTPATDWFSVGVMLYEALTGRLPLEGARFERFMSSFGDDPPSPREVVSTIPEPLARATVALLHPDPQQRGSGDLLRECLSAAERGAGELRDRRRAVARVELVGRERESTLLAHAFDETVSGGCLAVSLHGPSGIGKTALVHHLVTDLRRRGEAIVLHARCHPHEAIVFKALDAALDSLCHHLRELPATARAAILPAQLQLLATAFPVFNRLPEVAISEKPASEKPTMEPHEVRRRAFLALRELLVRLTRGTTVVLWLDDMQWGDLDSVRLLGELVRGPDAPRMLVILACRDRAENAVVDAARAAISPLGTRHRDLDVGPLPNDDALRLAGELAGGAHEARRAGRSAAVSPQTVGTIAVESAGVPFLIGQLVRYAAERPLDAAGRPPTLAMLVNDRLAALDAATRAILVLIAVAGHPVDEETLIDAGSARSAVLRSLIDLTEQGLLARQQLGFDVRHDRLREHIVDGLQAEERCRLHRTLAASLARGANPDPLQVVTHMLLAGDEQQAGELAWTAGQRAAESMAFNRAIQLYEQVLDIGGTSLPRWQVLARLAEVTASAGVGRLAAERFDEAARLLAATNPDDERVLELRRQAAEQFLRSGYREEGFAVIRVVLRSVGLRYPRSALRSLLYVLLNRPFLGVRRRLSRLGSGTASPQTIRRLETCWSAGLGLGTFDIVRGAEFQIRHAIEAARVGDLRHRARAMAVEGFILTMEGGDRKRHRGRQLLVEAERIARERDDPNLLAHVLLIEGGNAFFAAGWQLARDRSRTAESVCRERGHGVGWELAHAQLFFLNALGYLGEIAELRAAMLAMMHDARERDDRLGIARYPIGIAALGFLAANECAEARTHAAAAVMSASPGQSPILYFLGLQALTLIDLYEGRARDAWHRLSRTWHRLRVSQVFRVEKMRIELWDLRARSALSLLGARGASAATPDERRALLRFVHRAQRRLRRESMPYAALLADLLQAGGQAAMHDRDQAIQSLERASISADNHDMRILAAAARLQAAGLRGSPDASTTAIMRAQGIVAPDRFAAMLVPVSSAIGPSWQPVPGGSSSVD